MTERRWGVVSDPVLLLLLLLLLLLGYKNISKAPEQIVTKRRDFSCCLNCLYIADVLAS